MEERPIRGQAEADGLRLQVATEAGVIQWVGLRTDQLFLLQVKPATTGPSSLSLSHSLQACVPILQQQPQFLLGDLVWVHWTPALAARTAPVRTLRQWGLQLPVSVQRS